MERLEMFVQALLVLLTAIHVTAACICSMLTWEAAMCPANNKTVVLARLLSSSGELYDDEGRYVSVASSAIQGRYQMELNTIFKNGSIPLLVLDNKITMVFPVKEVSCGHHFTQDTDFVIGGVVLFGGILSSSMCQLLVPYEDVANVRRITQILQGEADLNC